MRAAEEVLQHVKLPFDSPLHEYQHEDIDLAAAVDRYGLFLDLGLGKSVMAALVGGYKLLHDMFNTVIVLAPAALGDQWKVMLDTMGFVTLWYKGTPGERKKMSLDFDFIVMSYEIFQKDYVRFRDLGAYFIVDEATIMSNSQNTLWKMINGGLVSRKKKNPKDPKLPPIIEKTQYPNLNKGCSLLTATPANKPADAYGLIKMLTPSVYQNYSQFERFHVAEFDHFGGIKRYKNLDLLQENLRRAASIRSASDHLDLPEKVYNVIEYDLDPEHYALYEELVETRMIEMNGDIKIDALTAGALYNWAQKIILAPHTAGYTKDPKGIEILDTVVNGAGQILIVNKYVMINEDMMKRYGAGGCFGSVSRADQDKYINEFKAGRLRVLTCNVKSGGYGLNLQICNQVVLPEIPVTARDLRQVEGRVYRQGQQNRVVITLLVARKTIQRKLLKLIMERDDVMQEVIPTPRSLREDLFGR